MHAFISLFWFTVCVSVCVPSQAHLHTCVWRSEDKLRSWFSLPTMCVLGNKLSHQVQWQAPLPVSHLAGCLVMFVCVYDVCRKCRHASVSEYTCGGPRTTFGNQLSLSVMDSGDWAQVLRLVWQALLPAKPPHSPPLPTAVFLRQGLSLAWNLQHSLGCLASKLQESAKLLPP